MKKAKASGGGLYYKGTFYSKGKCVEIDDADYDSLKASGFISDCNCGKHVETPSKEANNVSDIAPKKNKDCKNCP